MKGTILSIILSLFISSPLMAQTVVNVTTTNDELNGDANISLREAIQMANQGAGAYVINLSSGATYNLSIAGSDDANLSGDLDVTRPDIVLTIDGNGNGSGPPATIDASGVNNPSLSLFNSVIQIHGSGSTSGSQITLNDLVLTGANSSNFGGGVAFAGSSATGESLTINRCHITLNSSQTGGAGMSATNVETVSVNDSTLSDNSTSSVGGAINQTLGTLNLNNSTVSGNSASSGGAMYLSAAGSVIRSSTIYNNDDGMVVFAPGSDIDMKNSILSGNIGGDCDSPFPTPSNLVSNGYNVLGSLGTCVLTGPQTGDASGNPMLAALADNGGNTPTHALLAGSPAIDNGDPTGCTDSGGALLPYDQRGPGFDRSLDGDDNGSVICDSGAFEAAGTIDEEDVEDAIDNLDDVISSAPATDFKNGNPQKAFMKKLDSVLNQLEQIANETDPDIREGLINQLKSKLVNDILAKSNGCPDEPDNNDWVTDCDLQIEIQGWVDSILNLLDQL